MTCFNYQDSLFSQLFSSSKIKKGTASVFSCIEVFVLQTFEVNVGHTQWRCALRTGAGLF
jgi:hypothetical protein